VQLLVFLKKVFRLFFQKNQVLIFLMTTPILFLVGCENGSGSSSHNPEEASFSVVAKNMSEQNVVVPRTLWSTINQILEAEGHSDETLNDYVIAPVPLSVELVSDHQGVLKDDQSYRVEFFEGGGELDLFSYVKGKGRFHMAFRPSIMNDKAFHWLYVSESPGHTYGDEDWGQGCGKILNLTDQATRFFNHRGLLLATGKQHYLHLMAGYFVVFQMVEQRLLLGYVHVKDSRYPQFHCSL